MLAVLRRRRTASSVSAAPSGGGRHALAYSEDAEWAATITWPRHRAERA